MARHHIRDNNGDLHFFNDEEYKQYRYRNGCLGALALLVFVIGGLLSKCGDNGESSSGTKTEEIINSEIQNTNSSLEDDNIADVNMLMDEHTNITGDEEIQNISDEIEEGSTVQDNLQEEIFEEVANNESHLEANDESYSEDLKSLKKRQKEERKRLKQLEKEAKRKAKEEAKEAKRREKEEVY